MVFTWDKGILYVKKNPRSMGSVFFFTGTPKFCRKCLLKEKQLKHTFLQNLKYLHVTITCKHCLTLYKFCLIRLLLTIYEHVVFVLTEKQSSCGHLIWNNVQMPFGPYSKQMWCMIFVWLHLLVHKTLIATRKLMLQNILISYLFPEGS